MSDVTPEFEPDVTIVQVSYEPGTRDPARVFRAMADLIEAFNSIDRDLARVLALTLIH